MSRSVRMFLTAMFGLVMASGFYTGCGGDECQTNADCTKLGADYSCKLTSGAKKCTKNTTADGGTESTTPDGTTTPDGETTTPDGETTTPDGETTTPDGEVTPEPTTEPTTEPGTGGSVGDICTQGGTASGTCQAGLICLGISETESRCFQDCTANNAVCAANTDGRTDCSDANETYKICVNNNATEGQKCGFNNESQANCKNDPAAVNPELYCSATTQKCAKYELKTNEGDPCNGANDNSDPFKICDRTKDLICGDQNTCVKATVADTLKKCGVNSTICKQGDICLRFSDQVQHGYCMSNCNPSAPNCAGGARCAALTNGGGACVPAGNLGIGKICGGASDPNAETYDTSTSCLSGMSCVTLSSTATEGVCMGSATSCQAAGACGSGEVCLPLQNGAGACAKPCTTDTECTANDPKSSCLDIGTSSKVCGPEAPSGPVGLGGICSTDGTKVTTEGCQKGLSCFAASSTSTQGLCTKECVDDTGCTGATSGTMNCVEIDATQGTKICVYPCSQPGQTCPASTTCISSLACLP
ncbi:MAG: hypothetical protein H6727_03445 [Myxococcales bacterium]|nr:hypothetical protein [Myxococcales bacterium]